MIESFHDVVLYEWCDDIVLDEWLNLEGREDDWR